MSAESVWGSILGSRIVMFLGAGLGVLLGLVSLGLLFWVEHHTITTARSLEEGTGGVITVEPGKVDAANDSKLVHLTGQATTSEPLTDPQFGIKVPALRLVREVEVYQWKETKTTKKKGKDKTETTYDYDRVWSHDRPHSSTSFHTPAGHDNPNEKPYADDKIKAADVKLGAFALTPGQVDHLPADEPLAVTEDMLAQLPEDLKANAKATPDGLLFVGTSPDAPQVGDVRIRFKVARPQTVTVVARQTQGTFAPYTTAAGGDIDLIKPGQHTAQAMFESAQSSNRALNWVLRVVCLVLMALGLFLVLRPVVSAAGGVTPESTSFNIGVAVLAIVASLPVMLVVIGLRWLFYQPAFGGVLLLIGAVALAGLFFVARSGKVGAFAGLLGGGKKWSAEDRDYLRRIALGPDNARLRLEFAGLLEKKRNPAGEFIRLSEELDALPEGDERREQRDQRWSELLQEHGGTWFQPLRALRLEPKIAGTFFPALWMHHGIIDEVTIDLAGILPEKAEQLFAAAPGLRVLAFHNIRTEQGLGGWTDTEYNPDVPAIVRVPQLKQIGAIKMSSLGMKLADLKALASSPNLANLTELDFSCNTVGPEGAVVVAQSSTLKRLRVLELRACDVGEKGAVALAGAPGLAQLITLNLGANAIGPGGATALASSAHLKNLQALALDENAIGPKGAQALAASPHFRALTLLDLSGNDIGPEGAQALAASVNLARLTTLKLNTNKLGGAGLRFLAASPHLGRLKVLELTTNKIDYAGVQALAACPAIAQLEELSLSYNQIGDDGFKALAGWAGLARVQKLSLRENRAGSVGIAVLSASPHLLGLKELDLSKNDVGLAGARALANAPALRTLTTLWIQEANLTSEGEKLLRKRFGDGVYLT